MLFGGYIPDSFYDDTWEYDGTQWQQISPATSPPARDRHAMAYDYARGVGVGPIGDFKTDKMLIAAIAETPRGNLYIQFHGDRDTVLGHRDEFMQFVMALRKRSG